MLIQFTVENFACFADEVLFSMVASSGTEHPRHVVQSETGRKPRVLRVAALYGANAHGKTKLIDALTFAQHLVVGGTKSGARIRSAPFRLDPARIGQPSRFEFVIDYGGIEYSYGFVVDAERIHEEWLFARRGAREMRWFERKTDASGKTIIECGQALTGRTSKQRGFIDFVAQGTRLNQLFLTEAVDRNVKKLNPLFEWFKDVLTIIPAEAPYQPLAVRVNQEQGFVDFMADFLRDAGTGINGVSAQEESLDFESQAPHIPESMRDWIRSELEKGMIVNLSVPKGKNLTFYRNDHGEPVLATLKTLHLSKDGKQVPFDLEDESSGTRRVMEILPILADVASGERVYVVDELDRKLHPLLSRLFVQSFINRCEDAQHAQFMFTTHDTHLMDLELLRRDEIWFFEKDQHGASRLYSLNDLRVRSDLKIEKSYLNGRFGGIPLIQEPLQRSDQPC